MSKDYIFKLSEYLQKIDAENKENDILDVRFYFFYLKKLEKLLVMRKSVTTNPEKVAVITSTTAIRPLTLQGKTKNIDLSTLSKEERQDFILENSDKILYDESFNSTIGKTQTCVHTFSDDRDKEYALEYLYVHKKFRNNGLAQLLVDEVKNTSLTNNIFKITGEVQPIDDQPKHFDSLHKFINKFSSKTGLLKNLTYVDYQTLVEIYKKFGFSIIDNPRFTNPRLEMLIDKNSIPDDKKLPPEFTRFIKNKKTTLLFA